MLEPILADVLITGNAFTKQHWRKTEKEMRKKVPMEVDGMAIKGKYKTETEMTVVYDDPDIDHISVYDFFVDPTAPSVQKGRYCIYRLWKDENDIVSEMTKDRGYINSGKMKELLRKKREERVADKNTATYDNVSTQTSDAVRQGHRSVEVLEYWTDERKLIILDRELVVYNAPNPYYHGGKPFAHWCYTKQSNSLYATGIIDFLIDLQAELNTTRRQRIDNVSLGINNMWKALRDSGIEESDLQSKPNGVIFVDDMKDLESLDVPDMTN